MIDQQLEALFRRWIAESEASDEPREQNEAREIIFTKDGLLLKYDDKLHANCATKTQEEWEAIRQAAIQQVEEKWQQAPMRIAILLKDQPSQWSDDLRNWLVPAEADFADAEKAKNVCREKLTIEIFVLLFSSV